MAIREGTEVADPAAFQGGERAVDAEGIGTVGPLAGWLERVIEPLDPDQGTFRGRSEGAFVGEGFLIGRPEGTGVP